MSKSATEDRNGAKKESRKHKKGKKTEEAAAATSPVVETPQSHEPDADMTSENENAVTSAAEVPTDVTTSPVAAPPAATSATVEERLALLEREVDTLRSRLAGYEGQEIFRRFRHHVMYDLVKAAKIDIPPRMNPKKRTNFPFLIKCIRESSAKIPEEWLEGLKGLEAFDAEVDKLFPLGFWDNVDNSTVSDAMIETYINKLPAESELRHQVRAMCRCCLQCTPPCARGNGNTPNKSANLPSLNFNDTPMQQQSSKDESVATTQSSDATQASPTAEKKSADAASLKVKKASKRSKTAVVVAAA